MRVSVVINTYNRSAALRQTLLSLRQQRYGDFEVVVVNGPSTDDTETVLLRFASSIKIAQCPEPQLARSRNAGIQAADGDIVAFIDDDAVPEPNWLLELTAGYDSPRIGAVGGIVYDHTGTRLQNKYACCYRHGSPKFDVGPPFDGYVRPGADPFLYLQGTNMSYSRKVLEEVGGFDENILHYFDDVETCLQVIDHDYRVRALPNAAVHHKYLPSHIRNQSRLMLDPYRYICDNAYFAFKNGRDSRSRDAIEQLLLQKIDGMKAEVAEYLVAGRFTEAQHQFYLRRLTEAMETGMQKGLNQTRRGTAIAPVKPAAFLRFPQRCAPEKRLTLCWIGADYPDRSSSSWVHAAAGDGHEVHVVTGSDDGTYRLDMEDGVWIHRLAHPLRWCPEIENQPDELYLKQLAASYHEVCKIEAAGRIDLIAGPVDDELASLCSWDGRFAFLRTTRSDGCEWATMEPEFQGVIDKHRSMNAPRPKAQDVLERVQLKWADVLRSSLNLSARAARVGAARLLNPARYPVDYPAEMQKRWALSAIDCLKEAYRLLLGRLPNDDEIQHWLNLAQSRSMLDVVRGLALSPEARKRDIPTDWLPELPAALGQCEPGTSKPISSVRRLRNHLLRLPIIGKAFRMSRRLFIASK